MRATREDPRENAELHGPCDVNLLCECDTVTWGVRSDWDSRNH